MNTLSAPSSRINARLDEQTMQHLASLKAALGVPVSEILRASLAMYDAAVTKKKPAPGTALKKIIGKYSSSDPNGSVNYKAHVAAYLDKKYPKNYK
jgi:Ribbon-helix-helix protein, copG family